MPWNLYDAFREGQQDARQINLDAVNLYIAIVSSLYTPDQNLHEYFSDITNEVSGGSYTAGGNQCLNPIVSMDTAGLVTFDADDPAVWPQDAAGFTNGRRFIAYDRTGADATAWRLIAFTDPEASDFGNVAGPLTFQLSASGLFTSPR